MKLLFLTTRNVPFSRDHIFIKDVYNELSRQTNDVCLGSIFIDSDIVQCKQESSVINNHAYYKLFIPRDSSQEIVMNSITSFFKNISPDIIHSNSTDTLEIEIAKFLCIPIVLTVHVGGVVCPRSKLNGFLKYDNSICDSAISPMCLRCISKELPFPNLTYLLLKGIPYSFFQRAQDILKHNNVYYLSRLIYLRSLYENRKSDLELLKYAHLIAANRQLIHLLELNGLKHNVFLLPHGVKLRQKLSYPSLDGKIKFYYVGRLQYAKGIEVLLKAFDNINTNLYELHILGEAGGSNSAHRYLRRLKKLAYHKNVFFHSAIPNSQMEDFVKDKHVMIHPTFCHEIYGIAIAESLSFGRPVIATKCGGAEMQIVDGFNGWLIEPNSASSMRKVLLEILEQKEILVHYANRCYLPHNVEKYATQLLDIYNKIIN